MKRLNSLFFSSLLVLSILGSKGALAHSESVDVKTKFKIGKTPVYGYPGEKAFFYTSGLAVNADGAANAYHPSNIGIDFLANAGRAADNYWWALSLDKNGIPYRQKSTDPYPGYYISTTALANPSYRSSNPRRFVDSVQIPFMVLPNSSLIRNTGVRLGDLAAVYNKSKNLLQFAIYADVGPSSFIGEGSIYLTRKMGKEPISRGKVRSGISSGIFTVVFPGSGIRRPLTLAQINAQGKTLFEAWGGMERLEDALAEIE